MFEPLEPVAILSRQEASWSVTADRPRRTGAWFLTAIAIGASAWFVAMRLAGSSDGASVPFYADAWTTNGVRVDVVDAVAGGLVQGDVVTGVAGRSLNAWLDGAIDPTLDRVPAEQPSVRYEIVRDGAVALVPVAIGPHDSSATLLAYWSAILFTVVLQGVACYVLWRRPAAPAAVALTVAAAGVTGSTLPWLLGLRISDITSGAPFLLYSLTAAGLYMLLWPAGSLHLPLALAAGPSGPTRRQLGLVYGLPLGSYVAALVVSRLVAPSATAWLGTWPIVQLLVIIPTVLAGIVLSIRTFRRATPAVRAKIRWVMAGGFAATVPSLGLLLAPQLLTGRPLVPWSAVGLFALPLPLGIAAAILRDRLFDIEVVLNRALVYGGATVSIVAVYAVSVAIVGAVLPLGGGFPASLLATGLAAIVALPIRDALQRTVNRLMYGDRDDPYRAVIRLGERLEGTIDPIEAPRVIARTVAESLRLPWAALRLDAAGEVVRTIAYGQRPSSAVIEVPLTYGAETVGALLVAPRSPSEPLSAADMALLEALARQAGAAVRAVGLTLDLVASRERLVAAREEERRRIRRDLHDGLGPTLAAIGLRAEVAGDLVARDSEGARRVLEEMRAEVHGALADIRRLVDELRPPALDELGLVGALQAQAARLGPTPSVDVTADGPIAELPAAVEVAAYRIAVEAMTNAVRHAGASSCRVRLGQRARSGEEGRTLEVRIEDDGVGLPVGVRPGIGLVSMRERAVEVGGTCVLESAPGRGTKVLARLPFEVPAEPGGPNVPGAPRLAGIPGAPA